MSDEKAARNEAIGHCLIALGHASGMLAKAERKWLLQRIEKLGFLSDMHRQSLRDSLDNPKPLAECWRAITDNQDRAYLLDQAIELFHADGTYCTKEQETYQTLYDEHFSQFDEELLQLEIKEHIRAAHELSRLLKTDTLLTL